ncbi:MAG: GIY-YIG nuclease family protein [Rhodospirillales bacterium]|nr:GIY-YIG nuclease family protein [Rhodospirillales bacterium]
MPLIALKDELPATPGAYVLVIRLRRRLRAWPGTDPQPRSGPQPGSGPVLAPGLYLYAGSANGPGGIRARVLRHTRRNKLRHWHVDRLTGNARVIAVAAMVGGNECKIVEAVSALPQVTVPAPGFGSSDCRTCPAHLLALPPASGPNDLVAALPGAVWWGTQPPGNCDILPSGKSETSA